MKEMISREFIGLYDKMADDLFQYCYLRLSDRKAAVGMVQEIFTTVWKYSQRKELSEIPALLYKTADVLIMSGQSVNAVELISSALRPLKRDKNKHEKQL